MTVFGCDASDYDWGRGPMDVAAMARDGIQFFTHKATEGTTLRHAHYGAALTRARDAGIPVLGAYHVVRSLGSLADQVRWYVAYLDEATPWWRSWPHWIDQVDLELWPYDRVAGSTGTAFADLLAAATGKTVVIYASRGQYGNSLSGSRPLWNADYPSGAAGHYRELYPGDAARGWMSYSGRTPVIWQYTSNATIGGQTGCDANAFRGTLDQLLALVAGTSSPGGSVALDQGDIVDICSGVVQWATRAGALPAGYRGAHTNLLTIEAQINAAQNSLDALKAAAVAPAPIVLTADQLAQVVSALTTALTGLVPTTEEIAATVDKAVAARLDGATIHTAGS